MIVAFDPGHGGGIALLTACKVLVAVHSMPLKDSASTGHSRHFVDGERVAQLLKHYRPRHAVIERVASRPGQGVSGVFAFGRAVGVLEGVVQALDIPYSYVAPQVWKRHHGLLKQKKRASLELARKLYPKADLPLVKHEGRAEALLIGLWKVEQWNADD